MKSLSLFVLITLISFNIFAQNFEQVYPEYDVGQLKFFEMNDAGIGYVIGKCNILYNTTNGGDSWDLKTLPSLSTFNSKVLNLSENKDSESVFMDRSALYISKNNGTDWTKVVTNIDPTITGTFYNMAVANNGDILVNTFNGVLLKSKDKGLTWEVIDVGATVRLNLISISKGDNVWVTDNKSNVYGSVDNGTTWSMTYSHPERISKLQFISDKIGFLVDQKSKLYKTIDGGKNWLAHMENATLITSQMFVRSENEFWFNNNLTIFTTPDAGNNWVNITKPKTVDVIFSFIHFEKDVVWLVGTNNVIMKSLDNGITWTVMNRVKANDLNNAIVDEDNIFAVGNHGYLLTSTDGGANWMDDNIEDVKIYDIERMDNQTVMLATQDGLKMYKNGKVLDHPDLTESVIILKSEPTSNKLFAVTEKAPSELWMSEDDGVSWNMLKQFSFQVRGLQLLSKTNYLVYGGRTDLVKTNNAGIEWQKIDIPDGNYIHAVSGYEENNIVVLDAITLLFSDDFGDSFSRTASGPRVASSKMTFVNNDIGYILGDKGFESELYETQDGGKKWTLVSRLCSRGSKMILNTKKLEIWIPSQGGSIYRLEDALIATEDEYNPSSLNMDLTAYPNPSSGSFRLLGFEDEINDAELDIYNVHGQKVWSQSHYFSKDEINVNSIRSNGIYWVIATSSKYRVYRAKLIIQ